jgi:putative DNA primase/helicase
VAAFEAALRRLDALDWEQSTEGEKRPLRIPLDDAAADAFDKCQMFYREQETDAAGLLKSFNGKLPGLTLRLALVAELARWAWEGGREPRSISVETLENVADLVADYILPMSSRVYGDAVLPPVERNAATLARHILKNRLRAVNARDLKRTAKLAGLREASTIDPALKALVEANWLRPDPKRHGGGVGRMTADYTVNPAAFEGEA